MAMPEQHDALDGLRGAVASNREVLVSLQQQNKELRARRAAMPQAPASPKAGAAGDIAAAQQQLLALKAQHDKQVQASAAQVQSRQLQHQA